MPSYDCLFHAPAGHRARRSTVFVLACLAVPLTGHAQVLASARTSLVVGMDSMPSVRIDTVLDLETVVQRALAVSPTVCWEQHAGAENRGVRGAGRAWQRMHLPTLAATTSMLNSNITSAPYQGTLPSSAYTAGLSSSFDVFTGGRRQADRVRATADFGAAQATDIADRYLVTLTAQTAFFETLRGGGLVEVGRASVTQAQQGLRYARDRVEAGTATRSDELRAELQLTTSRQQLLGALDTLQTAAYTLGRLVGADGPVGARPGSYDPRPLALADSAILRLAVDASPSVRMARAQQTADSAALRSTRTEFIPDVKVTAGYNLSNQTILSYATKPGWNITLGTSYPLFTGYQREDDVVRAQAAAEVARVTTLDLTRQAHTEAARLLTGLRFAEQNIALGAEAVQSAQEDLRVQTERYRAGIATELDHLTSELALTRAQLALVAARHNYQITRAQLEALVGRSL